jgi:hypothetical protein
MENNVYIVTVANRSYYPFLEIFLNSCKKNIPRLRKVFVGDAGLGAFRQAVNHKDWVELIDLKTEDSFYGVHSPGWNRATGFKTEVLLRALENVNGSGPVFLIDSDVCVLKDIGLLANSMFDLQVTTMSDGGHSRTDGRFIKDIASFMIFNHPQKSILFVEEWREKLRKFELDGIQLPHETPALNETLRKFEGRTPKHLPQALKFGYLEEDLVCADLKEFPDSYSVHFKSARPSKRSAYKNFIARVNAVRPINLSGPQTHYLSYLPSEAYADWVRWARRVSFFQRLMAIRLAIKRYFA